MLNVLFVKQRSIYNNQGEKNQSRCKLENMIY